MASNTLTNTKISVTYAGVLHSNGMQLPATGLEQVYDGYGNMSSIKIGRGCNGMTVCGPLSATSISTSSSLSASQINTKTLLDVLHPIGTVLFTFTPNNPGTRTGWSGTTWVAISQGRFIVGVGTGTDKNGTTRNFLLSSNFDGTAYGNGYGEYTHQLTIDEMPRHDHDYSTITDANEDREFGETNNDGALKTFKTSPKGNDDPHNNIPPSFGLYIWRRTA